MFNYHIMCRVFRRWVVSIILFVVVLYLGILDRLVSAMREVTLLPAGFTQELIKFALNTDSTRAFVPILAGIPFSGTYVEDIKSKFARYFLFRSGYHHYLLTYVFTSFLSGGTVILCGCLLSWGMASLVFLPMEKATNDAFLDTSKLYAYFFIFFQLGGFWATVGICMSTFMESKYIAYVSPFIVYFLLIILCERYMPDMFLLYPPNWTNLELWPCGVWSVTGFLAELVVITGTLFALRAEKRLGGL